MSVCYIDPRVALTAVTKDRLAFWRAELARATDPDASETASRCVAYYEHELRRLDGGAFYKSLHIGAAFSSGRGHDLLAP